MLNGGSVTHTPPSWEQHLACVGARTSCVCPAGAGIAARPAGGHLRGCAPIHLHISPGGSVKYRAGKEFGE